MMLQTPIAMTEEYFLNGFTWPDYVTQMRVNRERTSQLFQEITLSPHDRRAFAQAVAKHGGQLRVVALAEDWCGDAVVNLPLIARLAAELTDMDLRLFVRSANPDLAQAYADGGITSIPVLSFFDADWSEVCRWVERSAAAHRQVGAWMAARPEALALRQSSHPKDQRAYRALMKERLIEMMDWYRECLWAVTLQEIETLLRG
jgi:hypothetical protein